MGKRKDWGGYQEDKLSGNTMGSRGAEFYFCFLIQTLAFEQFILEWKNEAFLELCKKYWFHKLYTHKIFFDIK